MPGLSESEARVLAALDPERKKGVDAIMIETGLEPQDVLSALPALASRGLAREHPGRWYSKAKEHAQCPKERS